VQLVVAAGPEDGKFGVASALDEAGSLPIQDTFDVWIGS
jgi:hypothetical protein